MDLGELSDDLVLVLLHPGPHHSVLVRAVVIVLELYDIVSSLILSELHLLAEDGGDISLDVDDDSSCPPCS